LPSFLPLYSLQIANATLLATAIPSISIDRIFTGSAGLNNTAIIDCVAGLCAASQEELALPVPRLFCMQKLREVAVYNMNRVRVVWAKTWREISKQMCEAAVHKDRRVAMESLDALKQLAYQLLEKDEISNFHFQKEFIRPFEYVIYASRWIERYFELILDSLNV